MTYAKKTLSEIKLIHGDYGNFIKGQKLQKDKEKKYKKPPYQDLAASTEIEGETLDEKCWPGYEKKGMKTMFGKRYPNCVKKKKTKKEEFSDWRSDFELIDEKAVSQQQQKFFGMVRATQKGEMDNPSDEVQKAADSMTKKDVKKYASTKHDKLPKKIEENLRPLVKGFTHFARKLAKQRAKIPFYQLNRPDLTYVPKKSKLAQHAMYHGTSKKSADKIIKSGKFKKSVGDVLNLDGTVFNAKRAFATTDPKKAKFYANKAARRDGSKPEILAVKVRDSNIYNPMNIPNEYYVKTKHMKPVGRGVKPIKIKKGEVMQNSFNPLEEKLNSDDKPFVKKLVGKLRKGSKTHAKQADDLEKAMKENTAIESELVIQDWNKDDIKFTEIETVDIIKAKPLKENIDLDEGIKKEIAKKLAKKLAKQFKKAKNVKGPFDVTGKEAMKMKRTGSSKLDFPIDKATSQNIQTKSIINQAKKANELGMKKLSDKKSLSGKDLSKPIKVNLQKKIDFDKYLGGTPNKIQKKFGTTTPTGTFTDDLPPVKTVPLNKSQLDLMKKTTPKKIKKKVKKITMKDKMKEIENDPMSKMIKKEIEKETGTKTRKFSQKGGVTKGNENEILSNVKPKPKKPLKDHYDWRNELDEDWQKVNRKDKTDGLSKAAVKAYRRENPGSKLQTAVTKDPKKLKKGSKSAKRRLSFCRRMKGMKKKLTSAKTRRDPDSRINKALRRWNC